MRTRLIIAFIVVALLSALASAWTFNAIHVWYQSAFPSWLSDVIQGPWRWGEPRPLRSGPFGPPTPAYARPFFLAAVGLLLAVIAGVAVAASRRVLLPVRRLARAARHMSGGDLSVRVEPRGRDELSQLVTSFNAMAASLQD